MWILILITLTRAGEGQYGLDQDQPPTFAMQEFNSKSACIAASREVFIRVQPSQKEQVKMVCVPKGD